MWDCSARSLPGRQGPVGRRRTERETGGAALNPASSSHLPGKHVRSLSQWKDRQTGKGGETEGGETQGLRAWKAPGRGNPGPTPEVCGRRPLVPKQRDSWGGRGRILLSQWAPGSFSSNLLSGLNCQGRGILHRVWPKAPNLALLGQLDRAWKPGTPVTTMSRAGQEREVPGREAGRVATPREERGQTSPGLMNLIGIGPS